jgi:ligand-binding SRPBCC domain-containing protein
VSAPAGSVTIGRVGGARYRLTCEIRLPRPLEEVFPFFSDARNLEELTPPWLRFHVETPPPIVIAEGTLIDYRLRVRGVPVRWQSEIAAWAPPLRFVDRQRRGPYRLWLHEHTFERIGDETLVRDRVDYTARGGVIAGWIVSRDLRRIFGYRHARLAEIFASP